MCYNTVGCSKCAQVVRFGSILVQTKTFWSQKIIYNNFQIRRISARQTENSVVCQETTATGEQIKGAI